MITILDVMSAAPESGSVGTEVIVALLGAGSLGAIVAAVVSGVFSKRKLGAEATEIITKAAAGVVTNLQDENKRLVETHSQDRINWLNQTAKMVADHTAAMGAKDAAHAEEIEDYRRVLQLHVAWDTIAIAEVSKLGIQLPPAPPLLPPVRP